MRKGEPVDTSLLARTVRELRATPTKDCHLWPGAMSSNGYGAAWKLGYVLAHRGVYEEIVGAVPDGLELDHICRTPACVNPAHLEPVTGQVNTLRGVGPTAANALVESCPAGHDYDEANTYARPDGGRGCRTCRKTATTKYEEKRSAARKAANR